MPRTFSGIQPTGQPHLGNYLGALRWWVEDQEGPESSLYCVVDLHALTVPQPAGEVRRATLATATLLLAIGLDPQRCTLFVQSHVPAHSQLTWLLECTASMGELGRMTQFKEKARSGGEESARVGLFTYPVLMAADVLVYDSDRVPVGDDQRQHLELARDLAERFNARHGEVFVVPQASIPPPGRGARVMDLQEPTAKMSKSTGNPQGLILLLEEPASIDRKIRRAVTDSDEGPGSVRYDPTSKPGVSNLLELLALATGRTPAEVAAGYDSYGALKADTAAAVVDLVRPIQARYAELEAYPDEVARILAEGAERARDLAAPTLKRALAAMGLLAAD